MEGFNEKNQSNQRFLLWLTIVPMVLSMAIPMLLNYVETILFKPTLY